MRKWGIIALIALCVLAGIWLRFHQKPQDARGAFDPLGLGCQKADPPPFSPLPGRAVVVTPQSHPFPATQTLPASQPLVVYTPAPSRWKAVSVVAKTTETGKVELDAGLGYEWAQVKVEAPLKVPLTNWEIGRLSLPELSGDLILTPDRLGVGGSLSLTDYLDLEAGVSRRHDTGEGESYVGMGMHFRF